ncbi:uncharacterized protein LOC123014283 [Tribolium madens]|uniref:uncharacterized protein LOC123014283 n=1 Tax=Tribolium madens TaxID=41895 RepID=UPI001CF758C5|nr:uncharacterized protein LOC123014283 [Tribolium madens]XP_044269251.1 uncharacterized protein LOC123014283 [Tribolium madens]
MESDTVELDGYYSIEELESNKAVVDEDYTVRDHLKIYLLDITHDDYGWRDIRCKKNVEKQSLELLSRYFGRKTCVFNRNPFTDELSYDINYIKTLFPSMDEAYIREHLQLFREMPNRVEMALRVIVHTKQKEAALRKRTVLNVKLENSIKPPKIRKVSVMKQTPEASTSTNICIVNFNEKPCTITSSSETEADNDTQPLNEPDDYLRIVLNMEQNARKVATNSQDSDKTEIYSPETEGPLNLKVAEVGEEERFIQAWESSLSNLEETPSTSLVQQNEIVDQSEENFDLVKYVQGVTKAPPGVIKYHCRKLRLSRHRKPQNALLDLLINNVLSNSLDSDTSDDSESPKIIDVNNELQDRPEQSYDEPENVNIQLVNHLCSMIPDACPRYIRNLCQNKAMNDAVVDELITVIFSTNNEYPKRTLPVPEPEVIPENQFEILREVLPDADPDYLRMMCDKFEGKSESVKTFINEAMEKRDYPKLKDYQRKQQLSAQQKQYTSEFDVKNFVKVIPNPEDFFHEKSRTLKVDTFDSHYALVFLKNTFNKLSIRTIQSVYQANSTKDNCNLSKTFNQLEKMQKFGIEVMKSVRRAAPLPNNITNIPLLQEIAYLGHRREITDYVNEIKQRENLEREEVKSLGLMQTCNCCYDEEVLPREIYTCENNCEFCKSCIVKSVEVAFGEGKLSFPCLASCESSFSLQTLQAVLSPKLFSKIAQKKALEEIKAAGIEELEMCPFCDFATIPAEGYNIFTCLNPECMKESCRMCKEPSHIPLRCEEIEKDADVKARIFVENKMTEALLRKCYKCGVKFFKEEGCNKMTCSCGASMCYICGKPVTDYKHFNGNGGDRYDLCPLYSDTHVLNKENVLKGAAEAKAELGNVVLKHDPTKDVQQHYSERKRKLPLDHLVVGGQHARFQHNHWP